VLTAAMGYFLIRLGQALDWKAQKYVYDQRMAATTAFDRRKEEALATVPKVAKADGDVVSVDAIITANLPVATVPGFVGGSAAVVEFAFTENYGKLAGVVTGFYAGNLLKPYMSELALTRPHLDSERCSRIQRNECGSSSRRFAFLIIN
jgi:hypothetical protein